MADERTLSRYQRWYRALLALYPRPYRERFAESMEQTFADLCRERAEAGRGLFGLALWMFVETSAGIVRENARRLTMDSNSVRRVAFVTVGVLLIPLLGNMFVPGWNWGPLDFVIWGALVFGTGLVYVAVANMRSAIAYRAAVGIACLTGFLLVWVNAAVGIIGDEDAANAMYLGVLLVGFIGACAARFEPRGMSRALVATAAAQALVPVIALTWVPEQDFSPGVGKVMALNAAYVALLLTSALLFRFAATRPIAVRESV